MLSPRAQTQQQMEEERQALMVTARKLGRECRLLLPPAQSRWRRMVKSPLFKAAVGLLLYFIVGAVYYTQAQGWTLAFSLYFAVVVVTTIGYGDQNPPIESDGAQLFTTVYILFAVGPCLKKE